MNEARLDLSRDEENNKKDHPISSREAIYEALKHPMLFEDLFVSLKQPSWAKSPVHKRILAMCGDQQLILEDNKFGRKEETHLITTVVESKASLLFVMIDGVKVPLTERHTQGVFPHDEVLLRVPVHVTPTSIPIVVRINTAKIRHVLCAVKYQRNRLRLIPFDQRIKQNLVLDTKENIEENTVVEVQRADKQTSKKVLKVNLVNVVGSIYDKGVERLIAKHSFQLADAWPHDIDIPGATSQDIDKEAENRESWTHLPLVTIDGADAKDYDDAVYCEALDNGYRLYVAIADVSHYVSANSELDKAAKDRGNSVYLPGHVVPMLPEVLSNNICSLLPDVLRLALGCVIDIDKEGNRLSTRLAKVVIKSHARLTYDSAQAMLDQEADTATWLKKPLAALNDVAKSLKAKRVKEGTIILRSHETKFGFDGEGNLVSVKEVNRLWSHQIIEECMLCANTAVGQLMHKNNIPLIYRSHNEPQNEKVAAFQDYLHFHDITLPDAPEPKDLQAVLDKCQGLLDYHAVEMMVLRTLSQAYYSPSEFSHYALSTEYYTHFTSPIRRYVDLTVHRAITSWLEGGPQEQVDLGAIADNCSLKERKADEASWFAQAWLKAKWVMPSVGKSFNARVVSITHFGMFVALEDMPIEGLVHISMLGGEFFTYHPDTMTLQGNTSGLTYGLGEHVNVRLQTVDLALQRVDFSINDS